MNIKPLLGKYMQVKGIIVQMLNMDPNGVAVILERWI